MKSIFFIIMLGVVGCAINSSVVPMGNNTFKVSRQASTGFWSAYAIKCSTLEEANQFCVNRGKSLKILLFREHRPPYILGNFPRAEVQFTCLDANDPELKTGEFVALQQLAQGKNEGDDNHALEAKLKTLNKLFSDGLVTQKEFEEQKLKLLNDYTSDKN